MLRFLMTDKTFSQKSNTSASQIYYKLYLENFIQNNDKIIEYLISAINQRLVAEDIVKP